MSNKNKFVIVVCVIMGILLIGALYEGYSTRIALENILDEESKESKDSTWEKEAFMEGCTEEGGSIDYCSCTYDYVNVRTTNKEMLELAIELSDGEFPEIIIEAISECLEHWD